MKKILFSVFFGALLSTSFAQIETFDLTSYTAPKGWEKAVEGNITSYTTTNNKNNTWCRINIVKSAVSKGDINLDFESEWQELIIKNYKPADAPQLNEVQEANGWKIKGGAAKFVFNNSQAMVFLTTATGYNRCVSIVATTNSQDYLKDIEALLASVDLKKTEALTEEKTSQTNTANKSVLPGTWGVSTTVASMYNTNINEGSMITQYIFYPNGTYTFHIKTFRYHWDKLLLTKENGTYQVNGDNLTLSPKSSVVEAWSRKNGTDQFGKLISSDKKPLEKTTYQFSVMNFGSGNTLILKANAATKRDGPFNNSEKDAWYYPAKSNVELIKLPG